MRSLWGKVLLICVAVTVVALGAFRAEPAGVAGPPVVMPDMKAAPAPELQPAEEAPVELLLYEGPVEHIFFHPLVLYPELAFDGDYLSQGYDDWFVTVPEFRRIVEDLYANGYILVDFGDLFTDGPALTRRELRVPAGKTPLIISIDDLNYYDYMRDNGNAHRLVVDAEGRVATYSVDPAGHTVISYENEIVPILDAFVADHPDFSLSGAKGVIALTGYEGILGYRTNDPEAPGYAAEREQALKVAGRLKELGWSFASHSWGHQDAARITERHLAWDTARWKAEVEPLIGSTPVYIFPFGSAVRPGDSKFAYLLDQGFRILASVGPKPYLQATDRYAQMDRRHIDGMAFRTQREQLLPLFDADLVIDRENRPQVER